MASVVMNPLVERQQNRADAFRWYHGVCRMAIAATLLSAGVLFAGNRVGVRTPKRSPLIRAEKPAEVVGKYSVPLDAVLPSQRGDSPTVGESPRVPLMRREKPRMKAAAPEAESTSPLAGLRSSSGIFLAAVALIGFGLQVKSSVVTLLKATRTVNGVDEKQK
eukprot:TRINITY_DN1747_c0_g1_i5.p1 TRINITY_DN1747_c0_g1~~TRINITY_DN1747_c0_g1_i5.p1  ORF type:complete len:163 (-),score=21.23 TRINITY_DN1747_c0_g1_i5:155-643(-)